MTAQEIVDILNRGSENFSLCCKLEELIDNNNIEEAINCIQEHFNCDKETANNGFIEFKKQIYDEFKKIEQKSRASLTPEQIAHANAVAREWQNQPKCPICSSTNIQKISITKRAVKTAFFGALGAVDDAGKTYQCKNCGSKF